jgi:hypothetical protein
MGFDLNFFCEFHMMHNQQTIDKYLTPFFHVKTKIYIT